MLHRLGSAQRRNAQESGGGETEGGDAEFVRGPLARERPRKLPASKPQQQPRKLPKPPPPTPDESPVWKAADVAGGPIFAGLRKAVNEGRTRQVALGIVGGPIGGPLLNKAADAAESSGGLLFFGLALAVGVGVGYAVSK